MKNLILCIGYILFLTACNQNNHSDQKFITSDIDNFWTAYDQISTTQDSVKQLNYLNELFIDKGSEGLKSIMQVRRYTPELYLNAINNYPKYWKSIRSNTLQSKVLATEIEDGVNKLKSIYPQMKPAEVYFEIGVFRTPGTTLGNQVLIGAEMALGNEKTDVSDLPENLNYVKNYLQTNPIDNIAFLNVHEFIHTQQNDHDYILIYRSVYEGIAEFITEIVTKESSTSPAILYGVKNDAKIKAKFTTQIFSRTAINDWLYNSKDNEFGTRDLGYYVGYAISKRIYDQAENKHKTIKEMIELDYASESSFNKFVDKSGYFDEPISKLKSDFFRSTPQITQIEQFKNGDQSVDPNITKIIIHFSTPMDTRFRGFDFGPLGKNNVLSVNNFLGFSSDKKSLSFETELYPNKQYQLLLTDNFISESGIQLKPYLIDVKTSK